MMTINITIMDLSRQLRSTALVIFIFVLFVDKSNSRFHGLRYKRHNDGNLYLSASSVKLVDEENDLNEWIDWNSFSMPLNGLRQKRQYGANLYLSESSITPGGEGDDPSEWTDWSSPSECSRTCGGGVSYQTRECLRMSPNGEPLCSGGDRRYYSCNTQDCPEDEPNFRSQQCSRFDSTKFDGVLYEWVPYMNAPNPCELNCMPKGERFYYRQKEKVIDGTRCNDKDLDICVNGQCLPVGCDMMLGSDAKEDKCRQCNGDGSSCKTITDTFTTTNLAAGYNDILLVPSGATNIRIQETAPSNNYLACRNLTGHYYLNGNWRIDFPRPMFYAGCWWNYQRKPAGFAAPDQLTCSGPITESIYIVMLVQDKNVSLDYEYSVPESVSRSTPDVYTWTHMEFSPCSASCGGGTQTRQVKCNNRINLQEVDPRFCDAQSKPAEEQKCGVEPCAPHWVEGEWTKCSKGCGADGFQNRTVSCERISPSGEHTAEEDAVCLKLVGNKPATAQECNRDVKNCPKYHLGPWTPCDKLCGEGKQTRKVTCYIEENGRKRVLPNEDCVEEQPETKKTCMLAPCEGVDWILSQWSGCEACGQNTETRTAICGSKTGKVYPDEFCAPEVPILSRSCESKKCQTQWFTSEWSQCSTPCGKGVQSRIVICGEFDGKVITPSDESKCDAASKPESEQECEGEKAQCPGEWFTGPWGPCNKECGGGERIREVLCLSNGTKSDNCEESKVEPISEKCNNQACTEHEIIPVDSTGKTIEDDDEDEECSAEDYDDEIEIVTPQKLAAIKLADGIDLDVESSTISTLITDELMLSDAPSDETTLEEISIDTALSTIEGSGDSTSSTSESSISTEGSGDVFVSTTESSEGSESTVQSGSTESISTEISSSSATSLSDLTIAVSDSSDTAETLSSSSTDASLSTEVSSSTDVPVSTDTTIFTDASGTTDDAAEVTLSTEFSVSTESTSDSSTDTTESEFTDSTISSSLSSDFTTESPESTESTSDSSTDTTPPTESTESTESSESTESTESTESSTDASFLDTDSTISLTDSSERMSMSTETFDSSSLSTDISGSTASSVDVSDSSTEGLQTESTTFSTDSTISFTDLSTTDLSASTDISPGSTEPEFIDTTEIPPSTESVSTDSSDDTTKSIESLSSSTITEETSESSSTELSESTVTGISETTDASSSTESESAETGETEWSTDISFAIESTTQDIWSTFDTDDVFGKSTPNTLAAAITKEAKPRKCKPKKKKSCKDSQYGCCSDNKTIAKGPFDEGCPVAKTCAETKYGCCLDGVSPAKGKNHKGCPKSQCTETLFGCCPDKYTPAEGEDNEGCPEPTTMPPTTTEEILESTTEEIEGSGSEPTTQSPAVVKSCSFAEFGCCPDGKTEAQGANFKGCPEQADSRDCRNSPNGCCPDGRTLAPGAGGEGCPACSYEPYGCCADNQTPAHGPLGEGCCLNSQYGCCPDNINSAHGPNFEDCDCAYTPYGCCPDKKLAARGPSNKGCPCENTPHGCCPDKITPANGPKYQGCPCESMQFGCCPDGLTVAQGPHHYGCHCSQTEFKCCPDEKTPAKGPNFEGCTCLESKFGCCADGVFSAQGDKFEGCESTIPEPQQKACSLPKDLGPCSNYTIKYHFDTSYGACAKFWYGNCGGNNNRFDTEADCKAVCEDYTGKNVCLLPKISGPCTEFQKKWYFDAERNRCEQFNYGGCYGNHNRFNSLEECQATCAVSESLPTCDQPVEAGPCAGNFERWYYDNETDICRPFAYGGCKGNKNNHPTEYACNYNCRQPGVFKDYCSLPKQPGDCSEQHPRWYFSETDKRCMPFYYTGCGGNKNNFQSLESCKDHCPRQVAKDICEIPAEVGECTNYTPMWYFDIKDDRCRQFYYGGCGGNENRFASEEACLKRCENRPKPTTPAPVKVCAEPAHSGECYNYKLYWYYDTPTSSCRQFYYGGCGGNSNRFATKAECQSQCVQLPVQSEPEAAPVPSPGTAQQPQSENVCGLQYDAGECDNYELYYGYNSTLGRCEPFYYGGCGGNGNRFKNEQDCSAHCEPGVDNVIQPDTAKCFLPAESGNCNNNTTRWYYNKQEGLCDVFLFTGCGGNANNFATEDDCQNDCLEAQTTCSLPPVRGRCDGNLRRWYFDGHSGSCHEFEFTGCRGNRNNFVTEAECLNFCRFDQQPPQVQQSTESPPPVYAICNLQPESGECENYTTAWFYDNEKMACTAFTYSGCGGNGNRFTSQEQCERQCGELRGVDVCNQPVFTGPCTQWQTRFYYNRDSTSCEPFTYGGCDGNGNRFNDRAECESVCIVGQEPQATGSKDICLLPVIIGRCNGPSVSERRWYYDDSRGTCISFIYSGCSGNQNNFRSYETCITQCGTPVDPNEIINNEIPPNHCESYEEECRQLRCPYGIRRVPTDEECTRCECENPCDHYPCPEGQQCAVDFVNNDNRQFAAICRDINKPGECPHLAANSSNCARECYNDADCRDENKCCSDGCGSICVHPAQPTRPTHRPTTPAPVVIYPGEEKASLQPKKKQELDVQTAIGDIAVLRCFATGNPPPNVTWSKQNVVIDTNQGRYVLTSNGDLTIVQVRQTDDGTYVCVASNGLGEPVRREVQLQVTEPKERDAYVFGDKNVTQIVTLNNPAHVRCPAGGYPEPHVSWWRNRKRLGLINNRYEQTRDYALVFRSIQLSDLGPYTCEVYNGRGRPASKVITLKAIGPARAVTNDDARYLEYIIDPARAPTTRRPSYPYYPSRPAYVPPPVYVNPPRPPPTINAQAIIALDPRNSYNPGSTIAISCSVQGYPTPNVTWTKDSLPLFENERIQITKTGPYTLVINNVNTEDTGIYGCTARNAFSYSTSEEKINIESTIPVAPECIDNPYFANCKLIVKGNYCRNHYYAKFCCRSCTLAGQIFQLHPNAL